MKADSSRSVIDIGSFTEDSIAGPSEDSIEGASEDFVGVGLRIMVDYIEGLTTIVVRRPNTGYTGSTVLTDTSRY